MKMSQAAKRMRHLATGGHRRRGHRGASVPGRIGRRRNTWFRRRAANFSPGEITIKRGETIEIVNDDGDLLHHAYVDPKDSPSIPATRSPAAGPTSRFRSAGTFDVLCAIHPKMKLSVHVQ